MSIAEDKQAEPTKTGNSAKTEGDTRPAIEQDGEGAYRFTGAWTTRTVQLVDGEMRKLAGNDNKAITLDLSKVTRMDTAGAWVIERLVAERSEKGAETEVKGGSDAVSTLLDAVGASAHEHDDPPQKRAFFVVRWLEALGKQMYAMRDDFIAAMSVLGATIRGGSGKSGKGHGLNITSIVHHIDRMGVGAIPVVCLMSAIVGAIVAQQGAFQLRLFGAEIFVVDLVGILVWRELGVLLTAIMIAGRTGSAITAEIGSMKMREEVDALTVIGLNPTGVLVFPRLVALCIALPCLTIAANFAALGGAILVTYLYSNIDPATFLERMRSTIDLSSVLAGLIKAPFMAIVIGVVSAVEGMKVGGSAESLGARVTSSVVKSIFLVIILDGFFAIFYAAIDF